MIGRRTDGMLHRAAVLMALALTAMPTSTGAQSVKHIVTQPARDVGIDKAKVPPLLARASEQPYSTDGTRTCADLATSIATLTKLVGPDFTGSSRQNRRNVAKIGGAMVVNSLVPFRGIVRQISGAEAAQRRRQAAITAGIARRGFLRGMQRTKGCPR